ncbi:acyl-CoA reductase [Mesonia aestuariivivens]|uniref:Acyl-CoA reductase n=1 Tax=Mesonia aestuariivivens TaxID=2796128 RepID=A0ABS6VYM0_9FLAO|nr:acyl-CoA reductase [Mesonia aestuariivivens]MBW2960691.1 acyl-CoA reductase [Mesonia aestuariivivens]
MTLEERKDAFVNLGNFLTDFGNGTFSEKNKKFYQLLEEKTEVSIHYNGWFTKENILFSIHQWANALTLKNLEEWLSNYSIEKKAAKTIAVIMAGNIPLVGFHDFLSVLITGNNILIKQSKNDQQLLPVLVDFLIHENQGFKESITFTKERLENFDAIIATGSNNTARYFEYYFSKYPHIIRKNRNSVAIITGNESKEELAPLGDDIFRYYGLGCRNVSKIFVPEDYQFEQLFQAIYDWNSIVNQNKYANNYDYNKAVYLMSEFKLFDNGFLILKEDQSFSSPIATLFYEKYSNLDELNKQLQEDAEQIQCIVSLNLNPNHIEFGKTQQPKLSDFADNVDTIQFLLNL